MSSNGIDVNEAIDFIAALQGTPVTILNLRANGIGHSLAQVAQSLHATQIHTLDLCDNGIANIEALKFLQNLRDNTTLQVLNLSYNHLADTDPASFAQALQHTYIDTLSITYTSIDDHWVTTFAQHLQNNNTLNTIDLSLNQVSTETIDFLRRNYSNITWVFN